jgi:hypothetical protein
MQKFDYINDQMLETFVNGQLDEANCKLVLKAMDEEPDIRNHVEQLRRTKDLMKLAYGKARAPTRARPAVSENQWKPDTDTDSNSDD